MRVAPVIPVALALVLACGKANKPDKSGVPASTVELECGAPSARQPMRAPPGSPLWLAIVAPALVDAIAPLADHRRNRGFEVVVKSGDPAAILAELGRRPSYIVLVGDEVAPGAGGRSAWRVATRWRPLYRWREVQREQFAADALWGDVDDDLVPEVPVGRLPARSVAELEVMVAKIIAYEKARAEWSWLSIPLWVGAAGYSPELDSMATTMLLGVLESLGPRWVRWSLLTGDPAHPLAAWPARQTELFSDSLKRGGALAFLMGHGTTTSFHSMDYGDTSIDFSTADAAALAGAPPASPLFIFTCDSGNFTAAEASLAEALLGARGGAVAAIAATTESHPLTNYFSAESMLRALASGARLGDVWLAAQRRALTANNALIEAALVDVEGKLEAELDVAKLRRDQLLMYAVLGDPAIRLRLPATLDVEVGKEPEGCRWSVTPPAGATTLRVDMIPAEVGAPSATEASDEAGALARYRQADAGFAFTTVTELAAGVPWQGVITEPGRVRLTALGGEHIWVRTFPVSASGD